MDSDTCITVCKYSWKGSLMFFGIETSVCKVSMKPKPSGPERGIATSCEMRREMLLPATAPLPRGL